MNCSSFGIIFDIDGTMVNNTPYHRNAWFELCRRYNVPLDHTSYHQKIHARSNDQIVPALFGDHVDQAFVRRIEDEKETLYRQSYKPVMQETPGLLSLLRQLSQASIPCAAASNSPKENVDFILDELNIRHFFQAVTFRDMVTVGKPNPELFIKAANGLRLPPHRCLVFEDSASGFKAARTAGMPYIAVTFCADPHELTEAHDAAAVCRDFTQLTSAALASFFTH